MTCAPPPSVPAAELDLLRSVGRVARRYVTYPPLSAFRAQGVARPYEAAVARRDAAGPVRGLAVYVHLPFCQTTCDFCSCAKIVTRDGGKAARYLEFLERDIAMQAALLKAQRPVARMHWGGGTPTYYTMSQLYRVWRALRQHFAFAEDGEHEFSIEIDPRTVSEAALRELSGMGFTVAVLCVPELDRSVLEAVARPQPAQLSLAAIASARRAGFSVVSVEAMYGLPRQTPAGFVRTLGELAAAQPDRIVLHEYIHAPQRHKTQRQVRFEQLPRAADRLDMAGLAVERLTSAGYDHVGAGCFVRGRDALASAWAARRLAHDTLGYGACGEMDILPVGASAVGSTGFAYTQNESDLGAYYGRLRAGAAPIARGITLSPDDMVRRAVMRLLLCRARVSYEAVEREGSVVFDRYFRAELQALEGYAAAGLLRLEDRAVALTSRGRLWVHQICSVFDRYGGPQR